MAHDSQYSDVNIGIIATEDPDTQDTELVAAKSDLLTDTSMYRVLWCGEWEHGYLTISKRRVSVIVDMHCGDPDCKAVHPVAHPIYFRFVTPELTSCGTLLIPSSAAQENITPAILETIRTIYDAQYEALAEKQVSQSVQDGHKLH